MASSQRPPSTRAQARGGDLESGRAAMGESRERELIIAGGKRARKEVPTLEAFAPRFVDGHVRANRHKP